MDKILKFCPFSFFLETFFFSLTSFIFVLSNLGNTIEQTNLLCH